MNERKRNVIEAAKQLFIEKGFSSASVQDILDVAKISKGTFYNYFSSKNECLIAILENGREETNMRRRELLVGKDPADKDILAEQISVRQQVNLDLNLMPILEAIFYSGDAELRAFAKKQHLAELSWLSKRLVDVYGQSTAPYAADCAVIMLGIMQHMIHIQTANLNKSIDTNAIALFTLRRIDSIIPHMIENNDNLLFGNKFTNADELSAIDSDLLISNLKKFNQKIQHDDQDAKQYVEFIIDEIAREQPRIILLETITRSFRQTFSKTPHELETRELAASIWGYLDTLK
ncbi:TetR/AcrR family transcriptional regulator [Sporosarcina sp. Marseille-Q4063]|uniref:TetR/AcrR family transcriptional regulator n=1 Tax=Sporosarcina sp. Marseille-Q4063 TaxID=2810514 RepID=UPI001BAE982E|nr:TetR/AcrR family transcriptional regulator [Sporosarcina sp. Marseille-Q4063]QUW21058.1 TetR/AcrR family transcriptional regulator [Sporosarcina sp. Marseille-Q4063]